MRKTKAAFVNGVLTSLPEAILVSGSGMAGSGDTNLIRTRRVAERFYICGDEKNGLESGQKLIGAPCGRLCGSSGQCGAPPDSRRSVRRGRYLPDDDAAY